MKTTILMILGMTSIDAMAGYQLANNGKRVVCYGGDNLSIVLNAKRTAITNTIEGESLGPKKITATKTDESTYVSYANAEGTLTLSNKGDYYLYASDREGDELKLSCK